MEACQGQNHGLSTYNLHHLWRNVANPTLAELLVRKLKNSRCIREELQDNAQGHDKTLFDVLTRLNKRAKKELERERKRNPEGNDSPSKIKTLNNLHIHKETLNMVKVSQVLETVEVDENSMAVKTLSKVDSTFLLQSLNNKIFESPLPGIETVLQTLTDYRNGVFHNDRAPHEGIWDGVQAVHEYMGKDMQRFKEKKRCYNPEIENTCYPLMRELQQEASQWYSDNVPAYEHCMKPVLNHLRDDCQSNKIVEDLKKFLEDYKANGNQEPILLCGDPGVGKTTILQNLVRTFNHCSDFCLVVLMEFNNNIYKRRDSFWEYVFDFIMRITPLAVQRHGQEKIINVLRDFSSTFLILWDLNLQDARNRLPYMDRGTWVLSYQGVPETSTDYCVLKVASLSEHQVYQVLRSISSSEEHYNQVVECFKQCNYKGIIDTPDMVRIFDNVCLEMACCAPFYKLIQKYINKKIDLTEENQIRLIKLGEEAFKIIKNNKKYYSENCIADDTQANICRHFLQYSPSKGYYFKYQVVEDYLAALYIVKDPGEACKLWLKQATLFKRVFQIACALWCEEDESLRNHLTHIREYLEKLFDICREPRNTQAMHGDSSMEAGAGAGNTNDEETMEVEHNNRKKKKPINELAMEVDDDNNNSRKSRQNRKQRAGGEGNNDKKKNYKAVEDESEEDSKQSFLRWVFLSKLAKEHQDHQAMLKLLAELLACKNVWHFKCKLLSEEIIDNISLVVRHVRLTKALTIKLETGLNVILLTKLWSMLCSHQGVFVKTDVHLFILHTNKNCNSYERELCRLPSIIAQTETPLHITKFVGPLLCSGTPQFLRCSCMGKLKILDVCVYDLPSMQEVLVHQQESLEDVTVKVCLKVEEQMVPDAMKVQLSDVHSEGSKAIRDVKIIYFKNLQRLLDTFEPPAFLHSLKIYNVFIHENFKLDLRRFTGMKSLFIRFDDTERLPPLSADGGQCEDKMEVNSEDNLSCMLPVDCWALQLVINLDLPKNLERFLMRNLTFCDDSRAPPLLNKYLAGLPFQRLVLLDTHLSLSKFRSSLNMQNFTEVMEEEITESFKKKCKLTNPSGLKQNVVKHDRLKQQERNERRKHKPKGKELIITSGVQFCQNCCNLACDCSFRGINNGRDTYEDVVFLVKEIYNSKILNVSYNGRDVVLRKDMCGDLQVQCPMPFLNDNAVQCPEHVAELSLVLEALALAQVICVSHTKLTHNGATCLIDLIREMKRRVGNVEPFRLTILSDQYHKNPITQAEVQHSPFMKKIWEYDCLQQFNFWCDCPRKCHTFKRSINKLIFFNNNVLKRE